MIACFAVGNSDDKLPQDEWSQYLTDVQLLVDRVSGMTTGVQVQFAGYSAPTAPWQNALWAVQLPTDTDRARARLVLRGELRKLAVRYGQDSIAWWDSERTEFLGPAEVPQVQW